MLSFGSEVGFVPSKKKKLEKKEKPINHTHFPFFWPLLWGELYCIGKQEMLGECECMRIGRRFL